MSQNIISEQLLSDDPKQRFQAVKRAARDKNLSVIDILQDMAANDPDDQVRAVAARAEAYIQGDEKVLKSPPPAAKKSSGKVDVNLATSHLNSALSLQMQGQRNKALKSLSKALQANPEFRTDPYFISILEATTRLEGEEAFDMLFDSEKIKHVEVSEKQMAKEKRAGDHWEEVEKSNWASASMDLIIYTMITVVGMVLLVLVMQQSAANVFNGYEAALAAYDEAVAAGDGSAVMPVRNRELEALARDYRDLPLTLGLIGGIILGVVSLVQVVAHLGLAHLMAKFMFKGQGTLPHLIYRVVSLYNTRLPVMLFLMYVAIVTTFSGDLGIVPMLLFGASGIVSLVTLFGIFARTSKTYDFSIVKAVLVILIAAIPTSLIPTIGWMLAEPMLISMLPASIF